MQALVLNAGAAKIRLAQRFGARLAPPGATVWRRQWEFFDNVLDKSLPQGSGLAKPLMLAFIALLASGALTRKQAPPSPPGASPASGPDAGGLLGGLGGLLEKLQQGGHGGSQKPGWIAVKINRFSPAHSDRRLVRPLLRPCLKRQVCPNRK